MLTLTDEISLCQALIIDAVLDATTLLRQSLKVGLTTAKLATPGGAKCATRTMDKGIVTLTMLTIKRCLAGGLTNGVGQCIL